MFLVSPSSSPLLYDPVSGACHQTHIQCERCADADQYDRQHQDPNPDRKLLRDRNPRRVDVQQSRKENAEGQLQNIYDQCLSFIGGGPFAGQKVQHDLYRYEKAVKKESRVTQLYSADL